MSVSGVVLTKTTGTAPAMNRRFADTSDDLVALAVRSQLAGRWRMATMNVVFAVIPAVIYLAAGLPATSGGMTIGTLVAFVALQSALFRPPMGLLGVGADITASLALFSRIFEYQDLPVEIDDPASPVRLDRVRGAIHLDHISFRYGADADSEVLHDVDLVVPAGTSLALVGETGSGKSTLAALTARLYDPTGGRITIDGIDLRDLRLADLAAIVADEPFDLIETLVVRLVQECLTDPRVAAATVTVHKPQAPIPLTFADVAVTARREQSSHDHRRVDPARAGSS